MNNRLLSVGAFLAALGVGLGAFGAHALKDRLSPADMEIWKTAAQYHLIHAVAVCAVSMAGNRLNRPGWLLTAGIIIFSGSLYVLAITQVKVLGAITPLGGVCFIGGWIWICTLAAKGNASP